MAEPPPADTGEAPATAEPRLSEVEAAALARLATLGSESVGKVDSQEKLAAVMVLIGLLQRGLVDGVQGPDGPIFSLTEAGRAALDAPPGGPQPGEP